MASRESRLTESNITAQEVSETIWDIFASHSDVRDALTETLQQILKVTGRSGGAMLVQVPDAAAPFFSVCDQLSPEWQNQLVLPNSRLQQAGKNSDESWQVIQEVDCPPVLVYPIKIPACQQGILVINGDGPSEQENQLLSKICLDVARLLFVGQNHFRAFGIAGRWNFLEDMFVSLNTTLSLDEIQMKMITGLRESFKAEAGIVVLMDGNVDGLVFKKSLTDSNEWIVQVGAGPDLGLLGKCLQSGEAVLSNAPLLDEKCNDNLDNIPGLELHSLLYAPLLIDEHVIGLVGLQNKIGGNFSLYDQYLLTSLANSIATLLYYLQNIQRLSVFNADLEAQNWELSRSRNTLRSLFDNLPDSLYIIDNQYRLIAVNMARAKRANLEPRMLVGKQCYEIFYNREDPCTGCLVGETLFNRKITQRIGRQWEEGEEPMEWEISSYPIINEMDQVVQAILYERDVTEKNRLEAVLAQSEKLAAVGQLAAGIAHEINNPLAVVLANSQMLQRELPTDSDLQELVDLIHRAGTRALHVVRNLLDLSRKERYDFAPTNINTTIERALQMLRHELMDRNTDLLFFPSKDLPEVMASDDHLQGVWLNIILNAMDASGKDKGKIKVTTSHKGNEVKITISDNGSGIAPKDLKRIFDPFFTTKDPGKGTGLGLSVCHRVIKQHGGHIQVDSKVGKGTTFTIVLPVY